MFRRKHWKIYNFCSSNKKEVARTDKNGEEITKKIYLRYCNLLIVQDLWQAHYQILSIIFLREFIETNVNTDIMIKNLGLLELNISIASVFFNT